MSAPQTDIEKQEKRHAGPLAGMGLVVVFALILLGGLVAYTVYNGGEPEGAETQIDSRTGAEEDVEGAADSD